MNELNQAQVARLRAMLEGQQAALQRQLAEDDAQAADLGPAQDVEASPADNACLRTLNELVSEASEHKVAQLRTVRHALGKFAAGTYGACEQCGEQIGISRLDARPEARLCIACQTSMEKARR